jgi:hypothetical protein
MLNALLGPPAKTTKNTTNVNAKKNTTNVNAKKNTTNVNAKKNTTNVNAKKNTTNVKRNNTTSLYDTIFGNNKALVSEKEPISTSISASNTTTNKIPSNAIFENNKVYMKSVSLPNTNIINKMKKKNTNGNVIATVQKLKNSVEKIIAKQEKFEQSNEPPPYIKLKSIEDTLHKLLNLFNQFLDIMDSKNKPIIKKEHYQELLKLINTFDTQMADLSNHKNKHIRNSHGRFVHTNAIGTATATKPMEKPYVKKPYLGKKPRRVNYSNSTKKNNGTTNKYQNSKTKYVKKNNVNSLLGL